jgi:hypothetical protein
MGHRVDGGVQEILTPADPDDSSRVSKPQPVKLGIGRREIARRGGSGRLVVIVLKHVYFPSRLM